MTLQELYDQLDWSCVDQAHTQWEQDHVGEVLEMAPEALAQQRLERLHTALSGLGVLGDADAEPDPRLWHTLPRPLRRQVIHLFKANGLYVSPTSDSV